MNIVLDAMGGDHAPSEIIKGAVESLPALNGTITLIGLEDKIRSELAQYSYPAEKINIVHAPEVIDMHDPATVSIRKKKDSSITQGIHLLKQNGYDAFISAGNTGAVVAAASFYLGMLDGVERAAIGLVIPTLKGFAFLIDVGATTEPKAKHLLQSAQMAQVYVREVLGVSKPTVGLLNIGEESSKGSGLEKETHKLMEETLTNFIGNIEPTAIFKGTADCIICDGYTGNVVIKVSEGLMESAAALIRREVKKSPLSIFGAMIMKSRLMHIKKLADYSEYGGAPLLGVDGIVMIGHGRSNARAITNAIKATQREVEHNILSVMREDIARIFA